VKVAEKKVLPILDKYCHLVVDRASLAAFKIANIIYSSTKQLT